MNSIENYCEKLYKHNWRINWGNAFPNKLSWHLCSELDQVFYYRLVDSIQVQLGYSILQELKNE